MSKPKRRALKAKELAAFLMKHPDANVYAATAFYNKDEPNRAAREFVQWEKASRVTAIEYGGVLKTYNSKMDQ